MPVCEMVICLTVAVALHSISAENKHGFPICDMTINLPTHL